MAIATTTQPVAGTYALDPAHTSVEAIARHLMVTKVRGRFDVIAGTIVIAENPAESFVNVTIDAASVDTREAQRDAHLKSADWLDVDQFPTIEFRSTGLEEAGKSFKVHGELTLHGVTRPVTLDATFEGNAIDPWSNTRALFSASTEINREDFGLTWNMAVEAGGILVSKNVRIELDVQATLQS